MSYLKLIDDKIQSLAESLSSVLNIDITVADENLLGSQALVTFTIG